MTFEYFNSSKLAFGQKLTRAFDTLDKLLDSADLHINNILGDLTYYERYAGRNYETPVPHRPEMPARVDEVLNILSNVTKVEMKWASNKLSVRIAVIVNGKPTVCYGETTSKSGYIFAKPTTSYTTLSGSIRFDSSNNLEKTGEVYIGKYRVDSQGNVIMINSINKYLPAEAYDESRYASMTLERLSLTNGAYTATEPMALLAVIYDPNRGVSYLNFRGANISVYARAMGVEQPIVLYADKGDTVSGNIKALYRIHYNVVKE